MTPSTITTAVLSILTLLAIFASVLALTLLMAPSVDARRRRMLQITMPVIVFGTLGLFAYRLLVIHHTWQPLESHVDGLILINALVAMMLCFLQTRKRMQSLSAFILPVLALLMAWAICASSWTFQLFPIGDIWATLHRLGVYLGSVFYMVAAGAGVMFLYVRSQLKFKKSPTMLDRLPSLEAVEQLIIHTATMGFALITLGLVSGVIVITSGPTALGEGWWYSPKVVLATLAWGLYAVVMNVRYTKTFRGSRAAWLSIVGFVLVLATFVAALVMAENRDTPPGEPVPQAQTSDSISQISPLVIPAQAGIHLQGATLRSAGRGVSLAFNQPSLINNFEKAGRYVDQHTPPLRGWSVAPGLAHVSPLRPSSEGSL